MKFFKTYVKSIFSILFFLSFCGQSSIECYIAPPRTVVSLLNTIEAGKPGHLLPVTFVGPTSTKDPLGSRLYWPEDGYTVVASGPTQFDKSGVTMIAQCPRYRGLERDVVYEFVEVVSLGDLGPVLELKQRITGAWNGSRASVGVAAPSLGIAEQWFDDTQWHSITIANRNESGTQVGNYVVSFCFYHKPSVLLEESSSVARKVAQGLNAVSGAILGFGCTQVQAMMSHEDAVRMGEVAAANIRSEQLRTIHQQKEQEPKKTPARSLFEFVPATYEVTSSGQQSPIEVLGAGLQRLQTEAEKAAEKRLLEANEAEQRSLQEQQEQELMKIHKARKQKLTVGGIVVGGIALAALAVLNRAYIPSPFANILYKIDYVAMCENEVSEPEQPAYEPACAGNE